MDRLDSLIRHLLRCESITYFCSKSLGITLRGGNILLWEESTATIISFLQQQGIGWKRVALAVDEDGIPITVTSHTLADMWRAAVALTRGAYPVEA